MSHWNQLKTAIDELKKQNVRFLFIRGFLKLPVTADTDLDMVVHSDDFEKAKRICDSKLTYIPKPYDAKILGQHCVYLPYKTKGPVDKSMANGCFRLDLYNNFFFHYSANKYVVPENFKELVFGTAQLKKFSDMEAFIPSPSHEIMMLCMRNIYDLNVTTKPKPKHATRIKQLLPSVNKDIWFLSYGMLRSQKHNRINTKSLSLLGITISGTKGEVMKEPVVAKNSKISTRLLRSVLWKKELKGPYNLVNAEESPHWDYLHNREAKSYNDYEPWEESNKRKQKFDLLIKKFPEFSANWTDASSFPLIAPDWRTGYRGVWYNVDKDHFEAYIYTNGAMKSLGSFANAVDAAHKHDEAARQYHNYTAICNFDGSKKPLALPLAAERNTGLFQMRDGAHRLSLSVKHKIPNVPCRFVLNGSNRPGPDNKPLEAEYHTTVVWQSDQSLKKNLKDLLTQQTGFSEVFEFEVTIPDKNKRKQLVQGVYGREIQFYGIGPIGFDDPRVTKIANPKITVTIYLDTLPDYHDNVKQNKRIPVNHRLFKVKKQVRGPNCGPKDFHSTDNATEHDYGIKAFYPFVSDDVKTKLKKFMNCQII